MKISDIKNPVSTLTGAGPATIKSLSNLNIFTIGDLLQFYPREYEDRTQRVYICQYKVAPKVHTIAKVISHEYFGYGKNRSLKINIDDGTAKASLICFNRAFLEKSIPQGAIIGITGKFEIKYNELQSSSFEVSMISSEGELSDFKDMEVPDSGIYPIYSLTQGLTRKALIKLINQCLSQYTIGLDDEVPPSVITKRNLLHKADAIKKIHAPSSFEELEQARNTLIYEELFNFESTMIDRAFKHKGSIPEIEINLSKTENETETITADLSPRQKQLLDSLPFALTNDQFRVINQMNAEIDRGYKARAALLKDLQNSKKTPVPETNISLNNPSDAKIKIIPPFTMQRLVQGDVGSGKTLVALFAALRIVDWGGQAAFMAPTEILARQHAENISRYVEKFNVRTAFLTGNVKAAGRKTLLSALKSGDIDILIGTHALFSRDIIYKDLQLAIIDEQHRFGVLQRQAIVEKGRQLLNNIYAGPHLLMMSATPIPQTLALTAFGDLDISTIKSLPQGRKPVQTYLVASGHETNAYNVVRQELEKGHQAYFVYPAIEEAEKTDTEVFDSINSQSESIKSAEMAFNSLSQQYFSKYKCALIHSKIPEEQQARILDDFRYGKIQLLFATTVVEVGVDVPNSTCMVIEQADRFGLSQLHQLRGRVGRGSAQGYCFLIYRKNITENGIQRMKILRESTDGFVIAEEDLKLRGPGEITGTMQSGDLQLGIADLSRDRELLFKAREDAINNYAT